MEFQCLMLLYTLPLYWAPRPEFHAERLKAFLGYLLDPDKQGNAWLGTRSSPGSRSIQWQQGLKALQWVEETFQNIWQRYSEGISIYGRDFAERAFHVFTEYKAEVFMDAERFNDCWRALGLKASNEEEVNLARKVLEWMANTGEATFYIGFSVDWSFTHGSLLWAPQLRISNFWPANPRLAPPISSSLSLPAPMDAAEAAHLLEDTYWKAIETLFRAMRMSFDLGTAYVGLGDRRWGAPVFYYAEPTPMPDRAEQLLELAASDLETIARETLGVEDLFSETISGGILAGNLLVFRRELIGEGQVTPYYLIIPWGQGPRDRWGAEVEREAVSTADMLAFLEFSAGFESYDILTDLAVPEEFMALWGGSLDAAAQLLQELHDQIAFTPRLGRKRAMAFQMVRHVESGLARLEAEIIRTNDMMLRTEQKWKAAVESTELFARRAFSLRSLEGIRSLIEGLRESYPYRIAGTKARLAVDRSQQVRSSLDPLKQIVRTLIEEESREEREREERNQRTLSYALAALAAVTALPLLIGQMGWEELQATIKRWPEPFVQLFPFLQTIQPILTMIGMAAALLIIFILMFVLSSRFLPSREDMLEREWNRLGRLLIETWELIRQDRPQIHDLRKLAFTSHTIPGKAEPAEVRRMREEVERLDEEVCERLVQVWEWLKQQEEKGKNKDRLIALHYRIHFFTMALELLDRRPSPLPLPRALCLYRYKSTDFVRSSVVSDFEFEQVLNGYGFDDDEAHAIDAWVEQPLREIPELASRYPDSAQKGKRLRDLSPREFLQALREVVGVSALHEREIQPPVSQQELTELLKTPQALIKGSGTTEDNP